MIRPLKKSDYKQWLPLWTQNGLGQVSDEVTSQTWKRLCDPKSPVMGFGLWDKDTLAGIIHFVLHPVTGSVEPACYMQDLFVAEGHRGKGYAKLLLWELAKTGQTERWARIYWFADTQDEVAQGLYKNIGVKLNFSLHVIPTKEL